MWEQLAQEEALPAGFAIAENVFRELSHKDAGAIVRSSVKFSLRPQTLVYMVDQERRIKTLEIELTLKTEEVMKAKAQLKKITEEAEEIKQKFIEDKKQILSPMLRSFSYGIL